MKGRSTCKADFISQATATCLQARKRSRPSQKKAQSYSEGTQTLATAEGETGKALHDPAEVNRKKISQGRKKESTYFMEGRRKEPSESVGGTPGHETGRAEILEVCIEVGMEGQSIGPRLGRKCRNLNFL